MWSPLIIFELLYIFQPVNLIPLQLFFIFYIKMANGSEVLLGLLLRVKTLRSKRNKQDIIVMNVYEKNTPQCLVRDA